LQSAFAFYVGVRFEGAHRARGDVKATALVLDAMVRRYSDMSKNLRGMHRQLTDVGLGGFRRDAGRMVFACDAYAGRALAEVAERVQAIFVECCPWPC
jgi:hypothetical protein